jgi:hypothetical protein
MNCKLHITSSCYHISELKDFDNLINLYKKYKYTSNEEGESDEQIVHV